jgi:biotin--protein ligase
MPSIPSYASVIDSVTATDSTRIVFVGLMLQKLGLTVNEEEQAVPTLSRLHLTSHTRTEVSNLVASWSEIVTVVDGDNYIKGENDVFCIDKPGSAWREELKRAVNVLAENLPNLALVTGKAHGSGSNTENKEPKTKEEEIQDCIRYTDASSSDQILDYEKIVKVIVPHDQGLPSTKEIPFHHEAFYANLSFYHNKFQNPAASFGKHLLYGEVVTSTNSLLEKNPSLLRNLPSGFTMTATTQIAGRGRGGNVWISPPGGLMFSTVMHHSIAMSQSAPVVFIQYLAALAIVQGIKNYAPGYNKIPVKLKWPNDIYAQLPGSSNNPVVKIGGILVNSSYSGSTYDLVCGIGLNLSNAAPTTSLNLLASTQSPPLKPFTPEKLLASILAQFESLYSTFCEAGFTREMEGDYYDNWLHTNQVVTLETEGGMKAMIKGITRDWGLLLAEELGWEDRPTGKLVTLQSDSNSFDFFRGLVRRKV